MQHCGIAHICAPKIQQRKCVDITYRDIIAMKLLYVQSGIPQNIFAKTTYKLLLSENGKMTSMASI